MEEYGDLIALGSSEARGLFSQYEIVVGSTGNLGLSIGLISAALGFKATVHMSGEAKVWKKAPLPARDVRVVEHACDSCAAIAGGRAEAAPDPRAHFVDGENSRELFLGYSVAALRLQCQLKAAGMRVDAAHPLSVYLPCGVGGAPGGITFALRYVFQDYLQCFFAEPVASPSMCCGWL